MKTFSKFLMLVTGIAFFAIADCSAQTIIRVLPVKPAIASRPRPERPSPKDVWVADEWLPGRDGYTYSAGYWSPPAHRGSVYVPGRWAKRGPGFYWVRGHWTK